MRCMPSTMMDFIVELAQAARDGAPERHVHSWSRTSATMRHFLRKAVIAQWNDDFHHAVHVLLTGESEGYYGEYADAPAQGLAQIAFGQVHPRAQRAGPDLAPTRSSISCRTTIMSATARSASV